ncbi:MAG TPA: hypothetical protein PLP61_11680 [Nocardioides sp.]|uniref:RCC1 domain-containing protein n=1 Tax=Nocardioides sp. TaxID=35761 RepID=UPI002CE16C77|nr:hypothetical protein [Nocardioides sp.]HQR27690.1 hypothetical protein [Nocardioides sp.]
MTGTVAALLLSMSGAAVASAPTLARAVVPTPPVVTAVAAGNGDSLMVGEDGLVYGTGLNRGQLTGTADSLTPVPLTGLPADVSATAVAGGYAGFSLVIGDDGLVYGTGDNFFGQITGPRTSKSTLTPLTGLPLGVNATEVAASEYFSLVLGDDGVAYGAGSNGTSALTGTLDPKRTLRPMSGLPAGVSAVAVAAGGYHSLVLGDDGIAYGTGDGSQGELTGTTSRNTLTPLTGLPEGVSATAIGAGAGGGGGYSLVLGDDGVAYGTGANNNGQLTGEDESPRTTLTPLAGLPAGVRAVGVDSGVMGEFSLVVGDDGVVYGTGSNGDGQLTGAPGQRNELTPLTGLAPGVLATAVACGNAHTLVLGDDGLVYGTGNNESGQLTGTATPITTLTPLVWRIRNLTVPTITGSPVVGRTLTARVGTWEPAPGSYGYQWYRDGVALVGGTAKTHNVVAKDVGTRLKVKVTAKRAGYQSASKTTAATAKVTRG